MGATASDAGHLQMPYPSYWQHITYILTDFIVQMGHGKTSTTTKEMENIALLAAGLCTRLTKHKQS